MSPRLTGLVALATAAIAFGFFGVFSRVAFDDGASVAGLIALRAACVLPLLLLLAPRIERTRRRREEVRAAGPALAGMVALAVVNPITYLVAVDRMSPAVVTLLAYVYPALTVLGSALLGWTRLGRLAILATALTSTGVAVTIGLPQGALDPLATALALANGVGFAAYLLLAQVAVRSAGSLTTYAAAGGISSAVLLGGAFLVADPRLATSTRGILAMVAASTVSTVLPAVLQLMGVRRLGSAPAALVTSLEIVTVVAASAVVFDEPVGAGLALGAALVIAGAALAPRAGGQARAGEPP